MVARETGAGRAIPSPRAAALEKAPHPPNTLGLRNVARARRIRLSTLAGVRFHARPGLPLAKLTRANGLPRACATQWLTELTLTPKRLATLRHASPLRTARTTARRRSSTELF